MLKRRAFLKIMTVTLLGEGLLGRAWASASFPPGSSATLHDEHVKDYLYKMRHFNATYPQDILLDKQDRVILKTTVQRFRRIEAIVGHGNFYLLNFDDAVKTARDYVKIGPFPKEELAFLEDIFYQDAKRYGFLGPKPMQNLTDCIDHNRATGIARTGNYVYKGDSLETFERIRRDLGAKVVLTSGLRGIPKQFLLFLSKADRHHGNISLASRSLAPPGYSYHGIGDFDVGHYKLGSDNFTLRFTKTDVYRQLQNLGYIEFRYQKDNRLGVRFEPWHVKVSTSA